MNRKGDDIGVAAGKRGERVSEVMAMETRDINVWFNGSHVLKDINLTFPEKTITGIIGPSGSGKSTLLRSLNRINDEIEGFKIEGEIYFNGRNIYSRDVIVHELRKEIGIIFQRPCTFPGTVFENVIFGAKHHQKLDKYEAYDIVKGSLKKASLWSEVSERLHDRAVTLSLGQQQRLCIARALAVRPRVILMDEPTSSLDPVSTLAIEELILKLKGEYTIVLVTHDIGQAQRVSDNVAFVCDGMLIEHGSSQGFFSNPLRLETREYLRWNRCEC